MATWHQMRRPVPLYHATLWTIVTDPPNGMRTLMTCATEESAKATLAKWIEDGRNKHSYILPPAKKA